MTQKRTPFCSHIKHEGLLLEYSFSTQLDPLPNLPSLAFQIPPRPSARFPTRLTWVPAVSAHYFSLKHLCWLVFRHHFLQVPHPSQPIFLNCNSYAGRVALFLHWPTLHFFDAPVQSPDEFTPHIYTFSNKYLSITHILLPNVTTRRSTDFNVSFLVKSSHTPLTYHYSSFFTTIIPRITTYLHTKICYEACTPVALFTVHVSHFGFK